MRYIPAVLAHMDPSLYEEAKNHLLNMTYADYFYIISYPTYDGYRIEHDPLYTAYFAPTTDVIPGPGGIIGVLILLIIVACIAIVVVVAMRRKTSKQAPTSINKFSPPPQP